MRTRALLLLGLAALAGCRHRRRSARGHRVTAAASNAVVGRWVARVATDTSVALEGSLGFAGALRVEGHDIAGAPYPARALVAAAHVDDGWLFAAADGTVYAAPSFRGALRVRAAFPAGARVSAGRNAMHHGRLGYVDADGAGWTVDGASPRRLPLRRVVALAFTSAQRGWAVVEPGTLLRTDDAGRTFTEVAMEDPPVGLASEGAGAVFTARGMHRFDAAGAPGEREAAPAPAAGPDATGWTPPTLLPPAPERAAGLADGTIAVVGDDAVRVRDAATGAVRWQRSLPGVECAVDAAADSLRLTCSVAGRRELFAPEGDGWRSLRSEARGEPLGATVFDDATTAFAVASPCRSDATGPSLAVCVHGVDGRPSETRLPFAAALRGMHRGVVLAAGYGASRAALLRDGRWVEVDVPARSDEAQELRWLGDTLAVWGRDAGGALVLHEGVVDAAGAVRWTSHAAPAAAVRGVLGRGVAYAIGLHGGAFWEWRGAAGFRALPSPTAGAAEAFAVDTEGLSYCAGPVCTFGGALEWTSGVRAGPWLLARAGSAPEAPRPWGDPPMRTPERSRYVCNVAPAPLAPGGEVPGGAVHWSPPAAFMLVEFLGETHTRTLTVGLPPTTDAVTLAGRSAATGTATTALFDRCAQGRCETFLVRAGGPQPFPLGHPGGAPSEVVEVSPGRILAVARGEVHGATLAEVVSFDVAQGQLLGRRSVVVAAPRDGVAPGVRDGREGLWVATAPDRWRFEPLEGDATDDVVTARTTAPPCRGAGASQGWMARLGRRPEVDATQWWAEGNGWSWEERWELRDGAFCARTVAGSLATELSGSEHHRGDQDDVQAMILRSDANGVMRGVASRIGSRVALACRWVEGRRAVRP